MSKDPQLILGYVGFNEIKMSALGDFIALMGSGALSGVCFTVGSLLPHARNHLINKVYKEHPTFTHLLMYDVDMYGLSPEFLVDAVNYDVIAPIMTQRNAPFKICSDGLSQPMEQLMRSKSVAECRRVGSGCMCIKREVLDDIWENTPSGRSWFNTDRQPRPTLQSESEAKIADLWLEADTFEAKNDLIKELIEHCYLTGLKDGLNATIGTDLLGEDITFCEKVRRNGWKVYTHCGYSIKHIGECAYGLEDNVEFFSRLEQFTASYGLVTQPIGQPIELVGV